MFLFCLHESHKSNELLHHGRFRSKFELLCRFLTFNSGLIFKVKKISRVSMNSGRREEQICQKKNYKIGSLISSMRMRNHKRHATGF